jgi:pyruvate kinase
MGNKLTKIIATIGPSSDSEEMIKTLIQNGVNVFRFNFKHGDPQWHKERLQRVKKIALELNANIATLLDLQGPEIRLSMPFDQIELNIDEKILLSESVFETKEKGFSLSFPDITNKLRDGQNIIVDDGIFNFTIQKENDNVRLISQSKGILKNNKTVNILNFDYDFPVLHEKDREGLSLAKENDVDFIALSFVRDGNDLKTLKEELSKNDFHTCVVAKIETTKALKNIDEIILETDVVMIARGDLGVEIPAEEVPFYQKMIIRKCMEKGIPVITATQMLESMIEKPVPTRAEVSDVANAVYDFTDAVMLSGETAVGNYPLKAVEVIQKVTSFTEDKNRLADIRTEVLYELQNGIQMISDSAFNLYKIFKSKGRNIKGFIVFTKTGKTARMISRYRPHVPVFAFSPDHFVNKSLLINFGVISIFHQPSVDEHEIVKEDIIKAFEQLEQLGFAAKGDLFIIIHGDYSAKETNTSTIKLISY